jgi:hypothetical protein
LVVVGLVVSRALALVLAVVALVALLKHQAHTCYPVR